MGQVLGRATVRYDGNVIESNPGAKLKVGGVVRTPRTTGRSVHYSEQNEPAEVELETLLGEGQSLTSFRNIKDATIEFVADTGQTWVVRGGFLTESPEITDGDDGSVPLKFAGEPAEEILS